MTTDASIAVPFVGDSTARAVDNALVTREDNSQVYRQRVETHAAPIAHDTAGRIRTSNLTTLFDGKILNGSDDAFKWDTAGTGTPTVANNSVTLTVGNGEYLVRQGRLTCQYFSGKPQQCEITGSGFQNEAGVIKRHGYFSSSAVAPYTANLDGWYIESDGVNGTYRLVTVRNGTETHNVEWTAWDEYGKVADYDWSKFTVDMVDFLWLGGAGLRLFMILGGQFVLIHTIDDHAGTQESVIMKSPNQPVRYEIRGVTAGGSYTTICNQVSSEGAGSEQGEDLAVFNAASLAANAIGTIYAVKGVRKVAAHRLAHVTVASFSVSIVSASTDSGVMLLILNPTLSAPLTWAANSRIEEGTPAAGQTITAGTGRVLAAVPINSNGNASASIAAALRALPIDIDNTADPIVLAYMPTSSNQNVVGAINLLEY